MNRDTWLNTIIGAIGFIMSWVAWNYAPNIPVGWALPLLIMIIFISGLIVYHYKNRENIIIPTVISAKKSYNKNSELLCILKPSKLFFQDMLVSFYHKDRGGFEDLIGIGRVSNIQGKEIIQVEMMYSFEKHKDMIDLLKHGNKEALEDLIIKHNVPLQDLYAFIFKDDETVEVEI